MDAVHVIRFWTYFLREVNMLGRDRNLVRPLERSSLYHEL
jgi:hypothetical protein